MIYTIVTRRVEVRAVSIIHDDLFTIKVPLDVRISMCVYMTHHLSSSSLHSKLIIAVFHVKLRLNSCRNDMKIIFLKSVLAQLNLSITTLSNRSTASSPSNFSYLTTLAIQPFVSQLYFHFVLKSHPLSSIHKPSNPFDCQTDHCAHLSCLLI